ncbi:MAG: hemolysin family protein [Mesorhizobium sp.]
MFELIVAGCLILLNGLFTLSELSIVSARKPRLRLLADQGKAGARAALRLADKPGRFLSAVQIGITLIGILAGAFSGAALGARMSEILMGYGLTEQVAGIAGYGLVIGAITFLSVIIGELVPKHLALKNAEGFACIVAPAMEVFARVAAPVVWLLDASTRAILRATGMGAEPRSTLTDEEIRTVIAEAESAGIIDPAEQAMIAGVMRLGDRSARALMTPRTEVEALDATLSPDDLRAALLSSVHTRLPVHEGDVDAVTGVVRVRDVVAGLLSKPVKALADHVRPAPVVPDTMSALAVLETLRKADVPMALVHDEFGHFEGVITPADILDAIAGAFRSDEDEGAEPEANQRADGSWLFAGSMPADEMADILRLELPQRRGYETVAGFLLDAFKRLPDTGEAIDVGNWRFEVVDLDGRRIDKVLATRKG